MISKDNVHIKSLFYLANNVCHFLSALLPYDANPLAMIAHKHDEAAARNEERQSADKMMLY
jgi:hypothetical protein